MYKIRIPNRYDKNLAYIDALIRGDGTLVKNGFKIEFSDSCYEMHKNIILPKMKKLFGIDLHLRKKGNGWTSVIKSKELFQFFTETLKVPAGEKSKIVKIPAQVMRTNKIDIMKNHVRGWMDAEGAVQYKKCKTCILPRASFRCASRNVRDGLVKLLRRINSDLRVWVWDDKYGIYNIEFAGPIVVSNFVKHIDFEHPGKRFRILTLLKNYKLHKKLL